MTDEEREAQDIDEDPRKQESGQGYPEENPAGGGGAGGPDSGTGGAEQQSPDTHAGQDDEPSDATGNPGAAGG